MSHTLRAGEVEFHYNGDFSGDVDIHRLDEFREDGRHLVICVPFADIKKLVAEYVRQKLIGQLEAMSDDEVLFSASSAPPLPNAT